MQFIKTFVVSALLVSAVALIVPVLRPKAKALPTYAHVDPFILTDSEGRDFDSASLKGHVWTANLFFTSCGGICPLLTSNLKTVYQELEAASSLELVSISVDPKRDDPAALQTYADKFQIDQTRWHFLTGAADKIRSVAINTLKLGAADDPSLHAGKVLLIDRESNVRGYYTGTDQKEMKRLADDARILISAK